MNLLIPWTKFVYIWNNIALFIFLWLAITIIGVFLMFKYWRKVILFNILLFIVLLNTVFLVGEAYFRFVFDYADTIGDIKTCQRWIARHVVTNADHFRDQDFTTAKGAGVTRIAVLGDSFAWGWGVDAKDRFSDILQTKLNTSGKTNYQVYNTSVPGWESRDELEFLEKRAGMFGFDTIILSYFLNDIYKDRSFDLPFMSRRYDDVKRLPLIKTIMDKSYFLEFTIVHILNFSSSFSNDINQREMTLYKDPQSWKNHEETLAKIIDYTRKNKQKLIVVIFPYLDLVNQKPYPAEFVHQKLTEFFSSKKIEVINLAPLLADYPAKKLMASPYDMHPSPLVHRLVAEKLYDLVR